MVMESKAFCSLVTAKCIQLFNKKLFPQSTNRTFTIIILKELYDKYGLPRRKKINDME